MPSLEPTTPTRPQGTDAASTTASTRTGLIQTLWAALAYAVATLTLAYPALAGKFLVSPISDQLLGGYPVREFAARMFHETGGIPLWNPYLFAGMPYVASMNGDIFYPTFLLRLILPPDVGMT